MWGPSTFLRCKPSVVRGRVFNIVANLCARARLKFNALRKLSRAALQMPRHFIKKCRAFGDGLKTFSEAQDQLRQHLRQRQQLQRQANNPRRKRKSATSTLNTYQPKMRSCNSSSATSVIGSKITAS